MNANIGKALVAVGKVLMIPVSAFALGGGMKLVEHTFYKLEDICIRKSRERAKKEHDQWRIGYEDGKEYNNDLVDRLLVENQKLLARIQELQGGKAAE